MRENERMKTQVNNIRKPQTQHNQVTPRNVFYLCQIDLRILNRLKMKRKRSKRHLTTNADQDEGAKNIFHPTKHMSTQTQHRTAEKEVKRQRRTPNHTKKPASKDSNRKHKVPPGYLFTPLHTVGRDQPKRPSKSHL